MSLRDSLRRAVQVQESVRTLLPESVATTIFHDFYGNRTGINNRIPVCPFCGYPVNDDFYGNRGTDASLRDGKRCECDPLNPNAKNQ